MAKSQRGIALSADSLKTVRRALSQKDWSKSQWANNAYVSPATITRLLNGSRLDPASLVAALEALGLSMADLTTKTTRIRSDNSFSVTDSVTDLETSLEPAAQLTIHRHQGQNPCFDEMLGEDLSLRMMQIPGGSFLMGSPKTERDRSDEEGPQHTVTLETFFLGKYPITQRQWRFVASLEQVEKALTLNPSRFEGDDAFPVEQVTWYDAVEFCKRLSHHTGKQYQLPTEAEWEYACRAGTTTPFHFGETITTELANYRGTDHLEYDWSGSYADGPQGECRETTTPVDYFAVANAFGLCDLSGNVWEWCADHWHKNYEKAPTNARVWLSEREASRRVIRGGSWFNVPRDCRSAARNNEDPKKLDYFTGLRVMCRVSKTLQPLR